MKQLRFTTTEPYCMLGIGETEVLFVPENIGEIIKTKTKGKGAYIHGDAEDLAGFDIPEFIDGDLGQFDLPEDEQDILMLLSDGEYQCIAEYTDKPMCRDCYLITLKK